MALNQKYNIIPDYGATSSELPSTRTRSDSSNSLYYQYSDNISSNVFSINNNVTALEKACQDIGTVDDSELLRDEIHRVKQETNDMVNTTMRFVKELKRLAQTSGREQRLQAERLEHDFRATVQRYDSMQKQLVPKMKQVMVPIKKSSSIWVEDEDEEKQSLIDAERLQQQKQITCELEFEHGLLLENEIRIKEIEADILDVNQIFKELASLVHIQGEAIGTIEENVTTVAHDVEIGAEQLSKASQYQSSFRKKVCWLILILLIVTAVIVVSALYL